MRGARGDTGHPLGDAEMGSVQGSGIQTGGWRAILDEVGQDLEDLRGVGDHGDDLHGLVTTRAAQGAPAVCFADLVDQAGPASRRFFGTAAAYDLPGKASRGRVRRRGRRSE